MDKDIVVELTNNFESHVQHTETGIEFWLARDLQNLLGYDEWRNFIKVIDRAKTACENSKLNPADHFVEANRIVERGNDSKKEIPDLMLTRYACYLIAQNGDPRKQQIAFAQTYFAVQTRKLEIIQQRLLESERLSARKKLAETEKELSAVIFEQTGSDKNFGLIRSKGDHALFGRSTKAMKEKWKIPSARALADFAPTIILKAKDFASEITIFNSRANNLSNEEAISSEHVTNNQTVRKALLERGIKPEQLPAEEDSKKLEKRLSTESKLSFQQTETIN